MPNEAFDRLKPKSLQESSLAGLRRGETQTPDRDGKRALFSEQPSPPALGSVALDCGACNGRSVVSWSRAVRLAVPSIPAVVPGSGMKAWMKCPACGTRNWIHVTVSH